MENSPSPQATRLCKTQAPFPRIHAAEFMSEGLARELVNRIQNLRKDTGLDVSDRITLTLKADSDLRKDLAKMVYGPYLYL